MPSQREASASSGDARVNESTSILGWRVGDEGWWRVGWEVEGRIEVEGRGAQHQKESHCVIFHFCAHRERIFNCPKKKKRI